MSYQSIKNIFDSNFWIILISNYLIGKIIPNNAKWMAHFGVSFSTIELIWYHLSTYLNNQAIHEFKIKPKYLIWVYIT